MGFPNQTLIQKADLKLTELTTGGGKLQEEQAKEFWRVAVLSSEFLQLCRKQEMASTEFEVPKVGLGDWTLVPAEERVALSEGDRTKVTLSKTVLSTRTLKAVTTLTYDQLEENIEGGTFLDTVRQLLGQAIARDLAIILMQGDTTITATDKKTRALKKIDGLLKQLTSNLVPAGGSRFTRTIAETMFRKMPTEFKESDGLAFLTSPIAAHDYAASLANRQTQLGDSMMEKMADAKHGKIPVIGVSVMPENLGGSFDRTNAVLCNPKQIWIGMGKEITIESDKDIDAGEYKLVARVKADIKVAHEPAFVKAQDILAAA